MLSEDAQENCMVDFEGKMLEQVVEKQQAQQQHGTEHPHSNLGTAPSYNSHAAAASAGRKKEDADPDEMVEYKDAFGRDRRCLRRDLPAILRREHGGDDRDDDRDDSRRSPPQPPRLGLMRGTAAPAPLPPTIQRPV